MKDLCALSALSREFFQWTHKSENLRPLAQSVDNQSAFEQDL